MQGIVEPNGWGRAPLRHKECTLRRLSLLVSAGMLTLVAVVPVQPVQAAVNASICEFNGNVSLSPSLASVLTNFTFSLSGAVSGCLPAAGPEPASLTMTGSGIGTCLDFNGEGVATMQWADGSRSTISLTIQQGLDVFEMTETVVGGPLAGDSGYAALAFEPDGICGLSNVGSGALSGVQTFAGTQ